MKKIEVTILMNLIHNEEYIRKVLPFLKDEYFMESSYREVFNLIKTFFNTYNKNPSVDSLEISIQQKMLPEQLFNETERLIKLLKNYKEDNITWLVDETEKYCKEKAVYNAILKSISIIDGKEKKLSKDGIPEILSEALSVDFDTSVGHDYINDAESRHDSYTHKEIKIPFDLEYFNKITRNGIEKKSLNVVMAGTGVGKSLFMCHLAANCLTQGKNVLYITMEMAEHKIGQRIDANLLNIEMDQIEDLPKSMFVDRIKKYQDKTKGKLLIKQFPTATAHTGHFKSLLNESKLKKNFIPDIVFVDYLNICASSRIRPDSQGGSYQYIKSIAEELRGLAVEYNLPVFTATQTNRNGFGSSDLSLTDTSESFGLPATADFMFGLVQPDELASLNQMEVQQLKNRYNDMNINKRFYIGVDKAKMRLYDVEESAQSNNVDSNSGYGDNKDSEYSLDKIFSKDFTKIKI